MLISVPSVAIDVSFSLVISFLNYLTLESVDDALEYWQSVADRSLIWHYLEKSPLFWYKFLYPHIRIRLGKWGILSPVKKDDLEFMKKPEIELKEKLVNLKKLNLVLALPIFLFLTPCLLFSISLSSCQRL